MYQGQELRQVVTATGKRSLMKDQLAASYMYTAVFCGSRIAAASTIYGQTIGLHVRRYCIPDYFFRGSALGIFPATVKCCPCFLFTVVGTLLGAGITFDLFLACTP